MYEHTFDFSVYANKYETVLPGNCVIGMRELWVYFTSCVIRSAMLQCILNNCP